MLPTVEKGFVLTKQQFWDSIILPYTWPVANLPLRQNDVRDFTAKLLSEVCHDVQVEPALLRLTGERMEHRTATETNEARLNIRARKFWIRGQ